MKSLFKRWCRLTPAGPFFCLLLLSIFPAEARRPNVLLILTDDQGSVDVNCYGTTDLTTPHLDALAESGVRFTSFYAAAPVCSPSRAGLLTGRFPHRAGVSGNVSSQAGKKGMPSEQITLAEVMKDAGYATGHIGKWHLGYTPDTMPNGQGFDYSFGHMGGCIDNYSHFFYWNGPNRHDLHRNGAEVFHDGDYFPDLMVEELNAFIDRNREQEWFAYWAINVPHYPYQGEEKWLKHYRDADYPRNLYAAFVSSMDERIGRVLKHLEDLKLRRDTIVIFQSDHGHSTEERAHHGGGSAGPYRGEKFSLFEGGIRVPAMISWPGQLPEGAVRDQMATGCDWFPTVLDLCGIEPPSHRLDGKSIQSVLHDSKASSPHSWFHWQSGGPAERPQWAVREGPWKLVMNGRGASAEELTFLSNLSRDVGERNNLASGYPDIVRALKQRHEQWRSDVGVD